MIVLLEYGLVSSSSFMHICALIIALDISNVYIGPFEENNNT